MRGTQAAPPLRHEPPCAAPRRGSRSVAIPGPLGRPTAIPSLAVISPSLETPIPANVPAREIAVHNKPDEPGWEGAPVATTACKNCLRLHRSVAIMSRKKKIAPACGVTYCFPAPAAISCTVWPWAGGPRGRGGLHAGRDNLESTKVNNNSVLFIIYHVMMFGIMMFGQGLLCLSSICDRKYA